MQAGELEQILFEELGYAGKPGLFRDDEIPWPSGRVIPDVQAALFLKNIPVAYFSRLSELDLDQIRQLHKNVWSQSKAPLLFVTLPHEIRVYNAYETPPFPNENLDSSNRLLRHLQDLSDHLEARQKIQQELVEENYYQRVYLETGAFWDTEEGQKFDYRKRADRQLIRNMGEMQKQLTDAGLSNHLAYTLLGRSIFIRYLEDRKALTPEWVAQITEREADTFLEALEAGRTVTYLLFEQLSRRFNGDLFPIEEAEIRIRKPHLDIVLSFLKRTNLETGQMSLWPYNFEYIPIELISHIYDTFIEDQRTSGAYYTPLLLADFILEETMGNGVIHPEMTVLDPACGSGIFLVGAYRRLLQAWRRQHGEPAPEDLSKLLQENVFGVDKNQEAVRIAAFSLYLEVLNHLSNEQIQQESFRFPRLQARNLLVSDFFAEEVDKYFVEQKFDRIIGNMPWGKSTLTAKGEKWLTENDYTVGSKQAAPAFMLRAPQFCTDNGEIALLAPAKSTILVTSGPHQTFRDGFFRNHDVRAVVNFSALVYELFPKAISPAIAIFYGPDAPDLNRKLVYGVPKPSPLSQHLKAVILDSTEVKFLDREELLACPQLWKIALWGTHRDAALIRRLNESPNLREQAENLGWTIGEGIQIGGGDENPAPWLQGMNLVPTRRLKRPYFVDETILETIEEAVFHRPRVPELTQAPLVLIRQSKCLAAYSEIDVAYRHTISGVAGKYEHKWLLYWLIAYINSPLAKYYHFLTSTQWAIERGHVIQWEYEEMPFLIPSRDDPKLQEILHYLDRIKEISSNRDHFFKAEKDTRLKEYEAAINQRVYELHGLHPVEQQQVEDTLNYGLGFFRWAKRKTRQSRGAKPVEKPDSDMLESYADVFSRVATSMLQIKDQTLNATVYKNGAPLTVVTFELANLESSQPVQVITQAEDMRAKLRELDELLLEQQAPSMYMRRHVRVYDGKQVSLVRPSERRFWTQSQARADADAFLAELSS